QATDGGGNLISGYDSRGNVGIKRMDGASKFTQKFSYDFAGRLTDVQVAADPNATSWRPFKRFEFGTAGVANGKLLTATRHNYLWQTTTTPRDVIVTDNYTYDAATGAVAERKTCAATIADSTLTNCDQAPASAKHAFTAKYSYNEIGALAETQYPSC